MIAEVAWMLSELLWLSELRMLLPSTTGVPEVGLVLRVARMATQSRMLPELLLVITECAACEHVWKGTSRNRRQARFA